jgi:hypothetical protein
LHQTGDVTPEVLVVTVRVDDDISPQLQTVVKTGFKSVPEAAVLRELYNMVSPMLARDDGRTISRSVIYDEDFDHVYAIDLARDVCQRCRQRIFLVETRDLYNQLHDRNGPSLSSLIGFLSRPIYRSKPNAWKSGKRGMLRQ